MVGSRGMPVRKRSARVVADSRVNAAARWSRSVGRNASGAHRHPAVHCWWRWVGHHTPVGTNARAPAPGWPHGARRGGDFSAVADPRLVFGSGAGLVHTPCDLAVNCCSPGSTNSDSDTRPPRRPPRCSAHLPLPSPTVQAHDHRRWGATCPQGTGRHRTARSTTARSSHRIHPRTASVYRRCWCRSRRHRLGRGCRTTGRRPR